MQTQSRAAQPQKLSGGRFRPELLPPAQSFYSNEIGKLSRPSRGWARGNCPFHSSQSKTSFSVNLDSGGFYCFGCGVHGGDVVAFVRLRYKVGFREACRYLGAWDSGSISRGRVQEQQRARERQQAEEAARQEAERRQRIEARNCLHCLERIYTRANSRLSELQKDAPEAFPSEREVCWGILSDSLPQIRTAEARYFDLAEVSCG